MNQTDPPRRSTRRRKKPSLAKTLEKYASQNAKIQPSLPLGGDNGAMPPKIARVLGPYRNRDKWRLIVCEQSGRKSVVAETLEEAERLKVNFEQLFTDRSLLTIGAALDEWLESKRETGLRPISIATTAGRLRPFLPLEETLGSITPLRAAALYRAETHREAKYGVIAAATHHKALSAARELFAWAVERDYIKENPFSKLKAIGKANVGKVQLREDEARKLFEYCLKVAQRGDLGALAIVVQLLFGLRSGEVLGLRARDLDAGGTVLVVEGTKSRNARRRLAITCEPVRHLLAARCLGLSSEALLFPNAKGERRLNPSLHKVLRRLCHQAGVPAVCPHSLRGLHSSLAVAHGESSRAVAQALGHGSDAITRKHYIVPAALDAAQVERVTGALAGSRPVALDLDAIVGILSVLQPERYQSLIATVEERRKSL